MERARATAHGELREQMGSVGQTSAQLKHETAALVTWLIRRPKPVAHALIVTADDLGPGRLEVRIEAWARGGDRISNLLFDRLPVNKEVQLHMWTSVLELSRSGAS